MLSVSDDLQVRSDPADPLRGWFPGNGKQLETWSLDSSAKDGASVWNYKNGKFHTTGKNSVIPPQPASEYDNASEATRVFADDHRLLPRQHRRQAYPRKHRPVLGLLRGQRQPAVDYHPQPVSVKTCGA